MDYLALDAFPNTSIEDKMKGRHTDLKGATKFLTTLWYLWKWWNAHCCNRMEDILEDRGRFLISQFGDILYVL